MNRLKTAVLSACAAAALCSPALAFEVSIGLSAAPSSVDPHYHNLTPNNAVASNIFDTLIARNDHSGLEPSLAESWGSVDDLTWEMKLRKGVKFHDGSDFDADDVIFSIERAPEVPNSPSSFGVYTRDIAKIEKIDSHTLRFTTKAPAPLFPTNISNIFIISESIKETSSTNDFNSGTAVVGTGAYKLAGYATGSYVTLERNPDYWGLAKGPTKATLRFISNDGARVAGLLAGDVDLIEVVPVADVEKLSKAEGVTLSTIDGLRFIYMLISVDGIENNPHVKGPKGEALDKNPLSDKRVRQALSMAVNRDAITSRLLHGMALPAAQFMPAGVYGYSDDVTVPAYDVDKAKALLAEAGYPDGFQIVLGGPNDRYVADSQIIQAVGQMWARIGVKASVEPAPFSSFVKRANDRELSVFLMGYSNASAEPSSGVRALIATRDPDKGWGPTNRGHYSDATLDKMLEAALQTVDDGQRETLLRELNHFIFDEVPLIPLHHQKNVWASRNGIGYTARVDEMTVLSNVTSTR